MPTFRTTPPRETKAAILRRLLARMAGTDFVALQSATGWQPHSVRAGLSGLRKAGYTIERADMPPNLTMGPSTASPTARKVPDDAIGNRTGNYGPGGPDSRLVRDLRHPGSKAAQQPVSAPVPRL